MAEQAWLVHAWLHRHSLRLAGRLADGRSFAAQLDRPLPLGFSLAQDQGAAAWTSFDGRPLLPGGPIPSGLGLVDEFLASRSIRGPILVQGESRPGTRVDVVYQEPDIQASTHHQGLHWLAIDIETAADESVLAVALCQADSRHVLLRGPELTDPLVRSFPDEASLLRALILEVQDLDPDIITGWNLIDFDLRVLERRCAACSLAFDLGRTRYQAAELKSTASGLLRAQVPGRQVLDAMRILRSSGRSFADYRLETVAQAVLGRGKLVEEEGQDKLAVLARLYQDDPLRFCRYCLEDAVLVLDILEATGLDSLTQARAGLTGVSLDLAWTSIPAFEKIYALELFQRRVLPPPASAATVEGAPGGTVLDPIPGLFRSVLVFDFRSLYPSIMRTFNIDPLVLARSPQTARPLAETGHGPSPAAVDDPEGPEIAAGYHNAPGQPTICAPNGACFGREPGILPELLGEYFQARQAAIEAGDSVGAFVYKILMNSFYGVLGSAGCLYGDSRLAGAITGFGRLCLHFARDYFRRRGCVVLYGDTDSVFVYGADPASEPEAMAADLNRQLARRLHDTYGVDSHISIRFDTAYSHFLLTKLRSGSQAGEEEGLRGRAKGYAGYLAEARRLEVKGMEAVRSDVTDLAKNFQTGLLELLFEDAPLADIVAYARGLAASLKAGQLDSLLVYRKRLRRPAQDYRTNVPPQVRAARLLGWTAEKGRVEYLMSLAGPEPLGKLSAPIDYRHYIDHQLRPIWQSIAEAADLGDRLARALAEPGSGLLPERLGGLSPADPFTDQLELALD